MKGSKRKGDDETSFKRKKIKTKKESDMRKGDDETSFKRKKMKTNKESDMDPIPNMEDTNPESHTAEVLSLQTIREGMLILGCVTDVKTTSVVVSLPGYLTGIIPVNNISAAFMKHLTNFADSSEADDVEHDIESIFKVGMVFPCKVIEILRDAPRGKPSITLSIDPQEVNANLKPSSLYPKMVLFVSVCSLEDHGYIVDIGTKSIQGFLPKNHSEDDSGEIRIGSVIPTYIKKIINSDKLSAKIQLSKLDFTDDFPKVTCTEMKLPSLLPGARIEVDVIEIKHPFAFMKYLFFDACASLLSLDRSHNIQVGSTIVGTVLYVHPITRMIYVLLGSKPTPEMHARYFGLRKFEKVTNLKFQCFYKHRVYYKIKKGIYGFMNTRDLPDKGCDASSVSNDIHKACAVCFHYMDNLVQVSAHKSVLEQKIVMPEDVKIGNIYKGVVKNHVKDGMLVHICPGLFGFVRRIHMSDIFVTKPELLHPTGSKVKCRVLSTDGEGRVNLTCKESLLGLQDRYILTSYDNAQSGQFYKGVIVKKTDSYILVAFFNDVKGIVSTDNIPQGSIFYEGQIVLCEIISSSPSKRKLKLSLETNGWYSIEDLDDTWDDMHPSSTEVPMAGKKHMKSLSTKEKKSDSKKAKEVKTVVNTVSDELCKAVNNVESDSCNPVKAVIQKVKGGQLSIMVNESKGRVHITELGCVSEGVYPLKEFSSGQEISVYVIGEYKRKKLLKITSRNVFLKECSLSFPAVSSQHLKPGISVIGFVKEVTDVCAVIWLSPTEIGFLDYLHFSENLKVVKKAHRFLKVGLSLKVSILEDEKNTKKRSQHFTLTKIERNIPEVGKNYLGLVQIGCLDRGLILKLPFGYHGVAALTDLTDVYAPVQSLFDKCQKLKFVLCHILEVNHQTKYCQVSLRKSRVYGKAITSDDSFCPEILSSNLKEGDTVNGFVKSISNTSLNVIFGRNLEGKVSLHNCSVTDCIACTNSESIHAKYPIGSIVKVDVEKLGVGEKLFNLVLADSRNMVNSRNKRLSIKEDISWDEIE